MNLRRIVPKDQIDILRIYFNSINSIDNKYYTKKKKFAWCSQAWMNVNFRKTLLKGKGWIIEDNFRKKGFSIRYPKNKLSLFYCKGNSQKKGYGTKLLEKIEEDAVKENIFLLETEASLISYKLLIKKGWQISYKEEVVINNEDFIRYKMTKNLKNYCS